MATTYLIAQNEVIARIRLAEVDRSAVKIWLNHAYQQVATETECLQKRATATLTANASIYTLPSAVIRIKEVAIKGAGQQTYDAPLQETTVDDLLVRRRSAGGSNPASSTPTMYALVGLNQFELFPAPAAADTLLMYYSYLPTDLSADADVPLLGEPWNNKLLVYGALVEAADYLDVPKAEKYIDLYERWMQRFNVHLTSRGGGHVRQLELIGSTNWTPRDPSTDLGN